MGRTVITADNFVSVPYSPDGNSINSRMITASGTTVTLTDTEYAALSPTAFSSGKLLDAGGSTIAGNFVTKSRSPAAATSDLFVVSGNVKIVELFGRVTTVMDATATTLKLVWDATVTGAVTDLSATATITSDVLGTLYSIVGVAATAMTESAAIYLLPAAKLPAEGIILPAGKIQQTASAANTGVIEWTCVYVPLSSGAAIVAA
jgi:hypothetical protein